jgi:hypothetical protein
MRKIDVDQWFLEGTRTVDVAADAFVDGGDA